jgi:hypothetical protein
MDMIYVHYGLYIVLLAVGVAFVVMSLFQIRRPFRKDKSPD